MSLLDLLLGLLANLAWGFNFIAGKEGAQHFQPLLFTALRFAILLALTAPWLKPAKGYMKPLLSVAFVLGVLHFSMMFLGLNAGGNIASVAIATQLYVPFSAILAAAILKESIGWIKGGAIVLALAGVFIIGFDPVVFNHLDALAWVVGAAASMAVATILMKQCPTLGVMRLQAWIALVATPSLLALSYIFEDGQWSLLVQSEWSDYWAPLYSAVAASIIGHGIVYRLLGRYSVSLVTPMMLLAPIFAMVFGVVWFGDVLTWKLSLGGALTLLGVVIINIPREQLRRVMHLLAGKRGASV
ncbi:Permease of the drug/metabolite transporter (DMT) superfamily [Hahella chejuensis KCTC 2396]|uniref:Permease of the drug/metabolite transporter (DMT) superfamily n=1 Tax=Hahella chejuensis (strain KCTC 2396) TaxID=349521 RepID=Q2SL16_HAHCH|nr:EamA family transporter [Hahella chejuensis]ABC28658.1 Permease of the drug/metabolite transporter (DMT) superfamily [Hahella chejuensis KCTC 2396]